MGCLPPWGRRLAPAGSSSAATIRAPMRRRLAPGLLGLERHPGGQPLDRFPCRTQARQPARTHRVVAAGAAAPLGQRIAELRAEQALLLEPIERGVEGAAAHGAPGTRF